MKAGFKIGVPMFTNKGLVTKVLTTEIFQDNGDISVSDGWVFN